MRDEFEKYIEQHRAAFDEHYPDVVKMWNKIEIGLDGRVKGTQKTWWRPYHGIAAALLLLLGIGSLMVLIKTETNTNTVREFVPVNQELTDIRMHYGAMIERQLKLIADHPALSQEDKDEFLVFFRELDKEYEALVQELFTNVNNEMVLNAIIENQKTRIKLIQKFLDQINRNKQLKEDYEGYSL